MAKPELGAINMAKFITAPTLLLLEKLDALDWGARADEYGLHDMDEKCHNHLEKQFTKTEKS
ncbi:Rop family plasmid primer RNA-binding protein [Edwardsiella ictaluri]|uniref:Rop family plasmid primer RNA-binding protein n=1 Tax=Edwardsiella ictaluri TaxID=67780 RepID=UPI0009C0B90F|nr:Rop family plasmid primer RNA-binding protein [Edwardsiella ictaluri]ARD39743.1 hypothetical protein B6E78_10450 [Edwardsiella ictaluri]QPW28191.1 Rop family plasmid primer RNA-binding protein [Edwardsiella ictaluri]